jgi:hypothetical protein
VVGLKSRARDLVSSSERTIVRGGERDREREGDAQVCRLLEFIYKTIQYIQNSDSLYTYISSARRVLQRRLRACMLILTTLLLLTSPPIPVGVVSTVGRARGWGAGARACCCGCAVCFEGASWARGSAQGAGWRVSGALYTAAAGTLTKA